MTRATSLRRRGAWIALVASLASPALADAQQTQTISRAELDAGGWTRLSELAFAARGVARTSVDGITIGGDVAGMPSWGLAPDNAGWLVLVDGQPVPVALGGATLLDLLPVSLAQLDSVTLQRSPVAVAGRIAMHGVLHLHTQRGLRGVRASASHYSGNEAGDPGPFAFTPEATMNVDNNGPFHQGRLAYGAPRADIDLAVRRWTDNLTDARLRQRYTDAAAPAAPDLWVRHLAPALRAGFTGAGGRHDAHAGLATLTGTFFVPAPRADQSLEMRLGFAGASGTLGATSGVAGSYRVHAAQLDAEAYDAPLPATLAHRRRELGGAADVRFALGAMRATAGVAAAHRTLVAAPSHAGALPPAVLEFDLLVGVTGPSAWRPSVAASVGRGIGGARAAGTASLTPLLTAHGTLALTAAASSRALGDDGAWMDLALFGLDAHVRGRRTSASGAAEWSQRVRGGAGLALAGTLRRETGLRLVDPAAAVLPDVAAATSAPASLTSGELRASLDLPFGGAALGGLAYRFNAPIGGFTGARTAAGMLPRHVLDASVTVVPAFDVRVRPALHLASGTRWISGGAGHDTDVPAVTRVDLSLEKWLLARRVRLQILGRNLLNGVERHHPLGADFRLRVYAGATATF